MTPLESLSWKQDRSFGKRHLAPAGDHKTLCGAIAVSRGPWGITREEFGAYANDPTSCRSCLEVWLRNRSKELHRKPVLLGKPRCECSDPKDVTQEGPWTYCNECHSVVEG